MGSLCPRRSSGAGADELSSWAKEPDPGWGAAERRGNQLVRPFLVEDNEIEDVYTRAMEY